MTYTDEQIKAWKEQHGDLYEITIEGYSCILRKPRRKDLSYISTIKGDPMKMQELLFNQLWVAGDEVIKTDDELFLGATSKMDEIIKVKEAEIKKL